MKVPLGNGFEDYDPNDPDIEFRKNRWDYWSALKEIRKEYFDKLNRKDNPELWKIQIDPHKFGDFVRENYGIQIGIVDEKITDKFEIVDEKLYTYFLLKHT